MDFLVSQSDVREGLKRRYETTVSTENFHIRYAKSSNATPFELEGDRTGFVSGLLFGELADKTLLRDAGKESLGRAAVESDGSFVVVLPRGEEVWLVTDAGGSIPVYYGRGPDGFAVGTLVHHVAEASGCTMLDRVSVVDYLFHETVCYPYSWYEDVRVAPPGSVCMFGPHEEEHYAYWRPYEPADLYEPSDEREWGRRLRKQVKNAVRLGLSGNETARVMYSGGMDSRAVLSLVPQSVDCTPTTVLDGGKGHREYEIARRSARLLGRELEWIPRPDDYYRSRIEQRIDTIGPGWDIRHTHIHGPVAEQFEDVDVVLGGYLADTLFKTNYMSNVERQGGSEKLLDPIPDVVKRPWFQSQKIGLWNDYVAAAQQRRNSHHRRLKEIRPRTAGNWHSLWPLAGQRFTYPHYLTTLRMSTAVCEPFLFNRSYQLAARMPDTSRVNSKAYRAAFAKGMGQAGFVMTSSGRVPRLSDGGMVGALAETVAQYVRSWPTVKRGIKALVQGEYEGPQGPWHPDHDGWRAVQPASHFSDPSQGLLYRRLEAILAEGQASRFFESDEVSAPMLVRALALGFR